MTRRYAPIWIALMLAALAVGIGFAWGETQLMQWRLATRYTARVGLPLVLIAYVGSALVRLWPGDVTRAILRQRRYWGLGFAITHSVHLVALIKVNLLMGTVPDLVTLIGGGGAYLMLYLMAATSNDAAVRALGVWWKRLHRLGMHWLWFVFTFSYFGRIFEPAHRAEGLVFTALCLAALGVRIAAWRTRHRV